MTTELRHFDESHDSAELMRYILTNTRELDAQVAFTTTLGMSGKYVQRVRMRISRLRTKLASEGQALTSFRLLTNIDVDQANQCDWVTITRGITTSNEIIEMINAAEKEIQQ